MVHSVAMVIDRLGERAAILREFDADPADFASGLEAAEFPGLIEAVACYDTVGIYFDEPFDLDRLRSTDPRTIAASGGMSRRPRRTLTIPVCYSLGEDLAAISAELGMTPDQFVARHAHREYRCFAIGFCPGFPYLGYLPEEIAGIPRRPVPRTRIEPGSVAVTGRQTGIYPMARPGGWAIVGRTPFVLVNVEERYFPIRAGDLVRFEPIDESEYDSRRGERL